MTSRWIQTERLTGWELGHRDDRVKILCLCMAVRPSLLSNTSAQDVKEVGSAAPSVIYIDRLSLLRQSWFSRSARLFLPELLHFRTKEITTIHWTQVCFLVLVNVCLCVCEFVARKRCSFCLIWRGSKLEGFCLFTYSYLVYLTVVPCQFTCNHFNLHVISHSPTSSTSIYLL